MVGEHGGAMAIGGETRGGPTYARKAAQARARLEGRRGGVAGATNRRMAQWCGSSTPAELRARRGRSLGLSAQEKREGSAGGSERAHGHRQLKAGAWAQGSGRGCRAAGNAGTWSPRGGSSLSRSWRGAATDAARGRRSQRAGLGWAKARWAGAGGALLRAALLARWAGFSRRARSEAAAREEKILFQIKFFKEFLNAIFQILFWARK
ncbi:uncharacterized protein [Miscanthus floridulus]|uniref:uncharacterized protein n=1 Tax=Miscanthus floridulus TaxID=154761 RepID=UPI00345B33C5